MQFGHGLFSRAITLAATFAFALVLSACVITSKDTLVSDAEASPILPASVWMFGYDFERPVFARTKDEPVTLTRDGNSYANADGSVILRFVPIGGEPGTYLVAIINPEGTVYGVGHYRSRALAVSAILTGTDSEELIATEIAANPSATELLSPITFEEGGLNITSRSTLDYLVRMQLEGRLPMGPVVSYIGDSADTTPPDRLIIDGPFMRPAN